MEQLKKAKKLQWEEMTSSENISLGTAGEGGCLTVGLAAVFLFAK